MALIVAEDDLGERLQFAKGGMAKVFDLPDFDVPELPGTPVVYKKYLAHSRPVPVHGLRRLLELRHNWDERQRRKMDTKFNWMLRVVSDAGTGAAGVLLPRLDNSYFTDLYDSYGKTHRVPREGQYLATSQEYLEARKMRVPTLQERHQLAYSLVLAIGMLHFSEVIYGDLSLRNFLYRLDPRPEVMVVDTDAMRPKGETSALGLQPHTPDWEPPEALVAKQRRDSVGFAVQNFQTDRYKLGLAVLRIHAFDVPRAGECRDPEVVRKRLPKGVFSLLEQSLRAKPDDRPTAKDWHTEMHR